ncbi:MAG: Hpt domain-containing protein [Gammaproteobacteria bacterium]|nr:Hpt domain-containing protein [Gammaproteobacteria bacterium]
MNLIVDEFLNHLPATIGDFQQAIETGNFEQIRQQAHNIKGVSSNISALELQHQSKLVEAAASAEDAAQIATLAKYLIQASEQLTQHLLEYKGESTYTPDVVLTAEQLAEQLLIVLDRLKRNEYIPTDELAPLNRGTGDSILQTQLNRLQEQIVQLDSEGALKTLFIIAESAQLATVLDARGDS